MKDVLVTLLQIVVVGFVYGVALSTAIILLTTSDSLASAFGFSVLWHGAAWFVVFLFAATIDLYYKIKNK